MTKRMTHRILLVALLLLAAVPPGLADGDATATVSIREFQFDPPELTVKVGSTVRWNNDEKRQYHSVWFESLGDPEPDYFFPGEFYERRFDTPGEFAYRCGPHPKMRGVVKVIE
jgi:plastocyanin